jgi:hypothetical protein
VCAVFGQDLVVETGRSQHFQVAVTALRLSILLSRTAHGEALRHRTRALPVRTATGGPALLLTRCVPYRVPTEQLTPVPPRPQ